jgi:hypothetical protein
LSQTLLAPAANAEPLKRCDGAEVHSIDVSVDLEVKVSLDAAQGAIEILPAQVSEPGRSAANKTVTVIALGPVLGSMDAHEVKTDLACTPKGIVLTASLTRSANYNRTTAKNILRNPRISIEVVLLKPEVVLETVWRMQLTTGVEVDHARTPPFPEQKYPIRVTRIVRDPSSEKR